MISGQLDFDVVHRAAMLSTRVHASHDLQATLCDVTNGVVDLLEFDCAALCYRDDSSGDAAFETRSVTGSPADHERLDGLVISASRVDDLLDGSVTSGKLRLVRASGWHDGAALLAPLRSADGSLFGVLSVGVTQETLTDPSRESARRTRRRDLLELFAAQAGVAVDNIRLRTALTAKHRELQRERDHLYASEATLRFSFAQSADGMARIGLAGADWCRFLHVNDVFCELVGRSRSELLGSRWPTLFRPESTGDARRGFEQVIGGACASSRTEVRIDRPDGSTIWLTLVQTRIDSAGELAPFLLIHVQDVSERRFREQELRRRAHVDDLTGLANRRTLLAELDHVVGRVQAREGRDRSTVLFCDLNRFKAVNDRFGHAAGDRALREVAGRLTALVRSGDVVARLGGDEFVIIAKNVSQPEAQEMARRIRADLSLPLDSVPTTIGVSIGIVEVDQAGEPVPDLLRRADVAMYAEKATRASA